jgi:hypothetical protein
MDWRWISRGALVHAFVAASCLLLQRGPVWADGSLQSIKAAGTTPALAQALDWLDGETFAVGRWDGTISVFRLPHNGEFGPVITAAAAAPSGHGIEMIAHVDEKTLVTSDGPGRLSVWSDAGGALTLLAMAPYDAAFGTANSGTAMKVGGGSMFVSGHEGGQVVIWRWSSGALTLLKAIDVRTKAAPANPWGLHNIRGLAPWRGTTVVTGSEDGDIVGLGLPDGVELFRTRFSATAQRGINSVSVLGDTLLVSNCAVGAADKNAWLFDLSSGRPTLADAENLELDTQRSQTFDFNAVLVPTSGAKIEFFATTEEGLLWQGHADGGKLVMSGLTKVSTDGGASMAASPDGRFVAIAAAFVRLFRSE